MKILHYLHGVPPVRTGGLPKYAMDIMQGQADIGHQVYMLIPGPISAKDVKVRIRRWKKRNNINSYRIYNPQFIANSYGINNVDIFMKSCSLDVYFDWLQDIDIDIIHVHSIMGMHCEFLNAASMLNIPIIFTTHDFFGLCPKIDLLKGNEVCEGKNWGFCQACCTEAYSAKRLRLEQSDIYRYYLKSNLLTKLIHSNLMKNIKKYLKSSVKENQVNKIEINYTKLQNYYINMFKKINFFHYNSMQTKLVYESILGISEGKVIPIINNDISDHRQLRNYGKTLRIGYLGNINYLKGFYFLTNVLRKLKLEGKNDFILNIYSIENTVTDDFINYHKPYNIKHLSHVFNDMDFLVVPSICKETFGFVVLEAISYGIPVLVSEHVGSKILIEEHPKIGYIFELNENDLYNKLVSIYENRDILISMNEAIIMADINLNFKEHINTMIDVYQNIIDKTCIYYSEKGKYENNI